MLADYEDGKIDGIIFYDIDRLAGSRATWKT